MQEERNPHHHKQNLQLPPLGNISHFTSNFQDAFSGYILGMHFKERCRGRFHISCIDKIWPDLKLYDHLLYMLVCTIFYKKEIFGQIFHSCNDKRKAIE